MFELQHAGTNGQETELYQFQGGGNGGKPTTGVIRDQNNCADGADPAEAGFAFGLAGTLYAAASARLYILLL